MKKALVMAALLISSSAFAESTTYKVEGMHCGACAKSVEKEVCSIEGIEKCEVSVGKVIISTKAGATVSQKQIETALTTAGGYTIKSAKQSK